MEGGRGERESEIVLPLLECAFPININQSSDFNTVFAGRYLHPPWVEWRIVFHQALLHVNSRNHPLILNDLLIYPSSTTHSKLITHNPTASDLFRIPRLGSRCA